jgi:hypothetical protein
MSDLRPVVFDIMSDLRPVVFDIDGVLADFMLGYTMLCKAINSDSELVSNGPHTSGIPQQQVWTEAHHMPEGAAEEAWRHIRSSKGFWFNLPPLVGKDVFNRIDMLARMRPVYFATARVGNNVKWQTECWLEHQGLSSRPTVVITRKKGQFCLAVDAEWILEDKAGTAVYVAYESERTNSVLIDRPYNQFDHATIGRRVVRVKTVEDFLDMVEGAV